MGSELLKAGRELDALVAENVMRWVRVEGQFADPVRGGFFSAAYKTPEGSLKAGAPSYSTDISAAWEVVEKLKETHYHVKIEWNDKYGKLERTGYTVVVDGHVLSDFLDTAPLAICLAALKAVEAS